jgi:integrase
VLILLAVFCSLRWGELAALRRVDIDLAAGTVKITRSLIKLPGGGPLATAGRFASPRP